MEVTYLKAPERSLFTHSVSLLMTSCNISLSSLWPTLRKSSNVTGKLTPEGSLTLHVCHTIQGPLDMVTPHGSNVLLSHSLIHTWEDRLSQGAGLACRPRQKPAMFPPASQQPVPVLVAHLHDLCPTGGREVLLIPSAKGPHRRLSLAILSRKDSDRTVRHFSYYGMIVKRYTVSAGSSTSG